MKIGVQLPATVRTGNMIELGVLAERLGFESFFVGEHVAIPFEITSSAPGSHRGRLPEHFSQWMDPMVTLAGVAVSTREITLGTGICLPALRNAVLFAKEVATLDVLSNGRVILGVGAGWMREECEAAGVPFGERWERLRETVDAMRILWAASRPSYAGKYVQFPPLHSEPKPVQVGGPKILLGAGGTRLGANPRVLRRVVESYDGWFPVASGPEEMAREVGALHRVSQELGRDPAELSVTAIYAESPEKLSTELLKRYYDSGVERLVLHHRETVIRMALGGQTIEILKDLSRVVERAVAAS